MPGKLRISAPSVVTDGQPFDCSVHVSGAAPATTVTVRLWERAGVAPPFIGTASAPISLSGIGVALFDGVVLAGPCHALLVADAVESATPLASDDDVIEVVK